MNSKVSRSLLGLTAAIVSLLLVGCSSSGSASTTASNGNVSTMASDAPANDWATVGVKILKISLNPMGGGTAVTVYVPPATVPTVNLAQLDQLGELLNNASVPPGTYTSATLSISANPGDVTLTASADPDPSFAWTAATTQHENGAETIGPVFILTFGCDGWEQYVTHRVLRSITYCCPSSTAQAARSPGVPL